MITPLRGTGPRSRGALLIPSVRVEADRGSATVELAIIAPALLALLGLVVIAGRITTAASAVDQAAAAGARAASLARSAAAAQSAAEAAVRSSLAGQGVTCRSLRSSVDVSGFAVEIGSAASTSVDVRCTVPLADMSVPGVPGQRIVSATRTSPIDRYRGRAG